MILLRQLCLMKLQRAIENAANKSHYYAIWNFHEAYNIARAANQTGTPTTNANRSWKKILQKDKIPQKQAQQILKKMQEQQKEINQFLKRSAEEEGEAIMIGQLWKPNTIGVLKHEWDEA